jgi:hypothetical protein
MSSLSGSALTMSFSTSIPFCTSTIALPAASAGRISCARSTPRTSFNAHST